ncbi:MAG: glycyl-radical enzyme activating protein [Bacteroidales bacterium]|nr:glycyl-radical enzyme activating protein [Bacteroidales bacterium]
MTKGFIFDIKRFAVHDGPGIRTTIFFKGCPLSCWWCHNPESRDENPQRSVRHFSLEGKIFEQQEVTGYKTDTQALLREAVLDRIFYEESGGGITLSGGEPLHQPEFCIDLLRTLKENGFHTALDTTGHAPEDVIRQVMPYTDLFLYDLKLMDEEEHRKYTGVSNKGILENLKLIVEAGKQVIIRFPVIPGITDTKENVESMMHFLLSFHHFTMSPIEIHLLPYHNTAKNKYQRFRIENKMEIGSSLPCKSLLLIKDTFENEGFHVKSD